MNKIQSNHYRMFLSTQEYLNEKTVVWNVIPRVVTYKSNFDELVTRITDLTQISTDSEGVTQRKVHLKKAIGVKVAQLSGVLQAYAYEINNHDMLDIAKVNESDIERTKDADVQTETTRIINMAKKHIDDLADFGITTAIVNDLETTLDEFNALMGKPRIIMNSKYVALNTLDELFDETNALLKSQLDKIMLMFKHSGNGFYNGYERARVIVD